MFQSKSRKLSLDDGSARASTFRRLASALACEPLEQRLLLANIVWANRNLASNNFLDTFGPNTAAAMNVIDTVIEHWERVIDDFNYSVATQFTLNITMRPGSGTPFSSDFGGQTPP